ncbi:MAG TPA: TolC family protein [Vicinamibacterales bacterium]|nr:TolC family protein [Vicinamibacterales bacterium]
MLTSVSAFGQTGQPSLSNAVQTAAQTAAQQPGETVRRLSIDDAVTSGLEQNLGIRIQRYDPQIQDTAIWQARSFWAPQLSATLTKNSADSPVTSILSGTAAVVTTGTFSSGMTLTEQLPWGANYSANWNNSRFTSTDPTNTFNPVLRSNVLFNFTQPLLRNRDIDQVRQAVKTSKKTRDLSDIQLESVVVSTTRAVKNAYWDLSYAINNLKAQQESLALAQQSLKDNQKRVEIGTMAPIDIVQAQAEVASNEERVILADAAIKRAQDNLRALILDPAQPDFWTTTFEPSDAAPFQEQVIDVDSAVRNALDKRTDLRSAKNSLERSDLDIRYLKNQILPDVNAQVNYGAVGVGGTQFSGGTNPITGITTPLTVVNRSYGAALGDVFSNAYPQWSLGVQIGYPLGAATSHANLARANLEYQQAQVQLKNMQLIIATQVRDAARNVNTNQKRVQSARASRELQEKKLEAEEKKLAAGMSSSFFVFQAQRDLALARTAEIQAISDYNKSLVDFDAVQAAPVTGAAGQVTTAGLANAGR